MKDYSKFLLHSGLITSEAIDSFNLVIELARRNKLSDYYDSELNVLCHFKHPKLFIHRTVYEKFFYITLDRLLGRKGYRGQIGSPPSDSFLPYFLIKVFCTL